MSPLLLVVMALVIFGVIFGGLLVATKAMSRPALAEGDEETGDRTPKPLVAGEPPVAKPDKALALAKRLRLAGIELPGEEYRRRVLMAMAGAAMVGLVMGGFGLGGLIFGGLLAAGAWKGGDAYIEFRHSRRLQDFIDQFTDALGVMGNGAKSGQTVMQTLETVAADFSEPLQGEVEEVLQELRMGVPMDEALEAWVDRMPCEDLEIAVTALIVQRQTGGNISEILETLASTIRDRNKLQKQIQALTSQGRMSGLVMSLLPVGLFVAFYLIAPARMVLMFNHPFGLVAIFASAALIATGSFFIRKIVTIEV